MHLYGVDWPAGTSAATMELGAYRLARDGFKTGKPAWRHMYDACGLLFPEDRYVRHPWVARRMQAFCEHPWQTWIGPGSTAKSTDAAMCILLHWLSAPSCTTCVVCSTTVTMLEKRIFGELIRYYSRIPDAPGTYRRSESAILLGDENSKNGIFGIAVLRGTVREALGNIIGLHNTYVGLIIDEMQATRRAAVEAATNLSSSGLEFVFLGMGNPESRHDPLGLYSEPKTGWGELHPDTCGDGWETKYGHCEFFDGYQCPAVVEPDGRRKYPFLLSKQAIDETREKYGPDSPQFWSQRRGFFPPEGLDRALFGEGFLAYNRCHEEPKWASEPIPVAGIDPAFSSMGDRCIVVTGLAGNLICEDGKVRPGFAFTGEPHSIKLDATSSEPLTYRLAADIARVLKLHNISSGGVGIDCTGSQGGLADILEKEHTGPGLHRVQFGGRATDLPAGMTGDEDEIGRNYYGNRVTELWHVLFRFCRAGLVRGVPPEMARELCERQLTEKLKPVTVEPKTRMKLRLGKSPDIADAGVCLASVVREVMGFDPEGGESPLVREQKKAAASLDRELPTDDNYLTDYYSEEDDLYSIPELM